MIEHASVSEEDFKEKTRRLLFQSSLRDFPVIFEMYVKTFDLDGFSFNLDESMGEVLSIVRTSENSEVAYTRVSEYLDSLE